MLSGLFGSLSLIFMRETYAPVILERKVKRLRKETGNEGLRSKLDIGLTPKELFLHSIIRPCKMLLKSPIVLLTSIYVGVVYGYLYLLFTTFTPVFEEQYHFSPGTVGLTFLGLGIGSLSGLGFFAWSTDRQFKKRSEAIATAEEANENENESPLPETRAATMKPEYRLQLLVPAYCLIPVGLFIYGVSSLLQNPTPNLSIHANYDFGWIVDSKIQSPLDRPHPLHSANRNRQHGSLHDHIPLPH
jgi:hypothetical protein